MEKKKNIWVGKIVVIVLIIVSIGICGEIS